jgi:CRISPR/Cas system-associated exonuclease Cas4 (RecB family)
MARNSLKNVAKLIDTANKVLPVEESFISDLKRSIEMTDKRFRRLPSKTLKPSGMNCKRASYYQVMGLEPDDGDSSFNMIGICNAGSDIHVRIQTAVMQMKVNGMNCEWVDVPDFVRSRGLDYLHIRESTDTETKLYDSRYNISFMCDGIIKYNGKYYILELKTETSSKWYTRTGVDSKHYHQAYSYSNSLQLNDVLFVYIDRDMLNMKAYLFNVTDEMRQEIVDYATDVASYVERQIAPPKRDDASPQKCRYCMYQTRCKGDRQ